MSAQTLDDWSRLLLATAFAIYGLAFVVYVFDLSKRAQSAVERKDVAADRELVGAAVGSSGSAARFDAVAAAAAAEDPAPQRFVLSRIGTSLVWLAMLFSLGAVVFRGFAVGHVPWSNMYEFGMTAVALIGLVYVVTLFRFDLQYLGAFVTGMQIMFLGGVTFVGQSMQIVPLMDPLKSVWLVIHVFVAILSSAFFALACGLSVMQLLKMRRERRRAEGADLKRSFLDTLPSAAKLEGLAYRISIVGFIGWTFTLIAGSIWANDAWGRYWGFDVKEVWTFVIWVLYAGYIHARATRGWRGAPSAWLSIVGFATVVFNFTVVNTAFKGLHAYSGIN